MIFDFLVTFICQFFPKYMLFLVFPLLVHSQDIMELHHTNFTQTYFIPGDLYIHMCSFFDMHNHKNGGALYIEQRDKVLKCTQCYFTNTSTNGRAGAIFCVIKNVTLFENCYELCCAGRNNGCDGSTIFSEAKEGNTLHEMNSYYQCPDHQRICWYGLCVFWNGRVECNDINVTHSTVEYLAGMAVGGSTDMHNNRYFAFDERSGAAINFMYQAYKVGETKNGVIANCSCKQGMIYCQGASVNLYNFSFIKNIGPISTEIQGGQIDLYNCYFDSENPPLGAVRTSQSLKYGVKDMKSEVFGFRTVNCNNVGNVHVKIFNKFNHIHIKILTSVIILTAICIGVAYFTGWLGQLIFPRRRYMYDILITK